MQSITLQTSDSAITAGDILGRVNFAASSEGDGGAAVLQVGSIYSYAEGTFSSAANPASVIIATSASDTSPAQPRLKISHEGHVLPVTDSAYDLGSSSFAFRNTYTDTFYLGGTAITATAAELNKLDGVTATTAELNYTDGVTSNIQTQLNTKAPTASPSFTGTPLAPTASAATNNTQIATTAYVTTAITNLIGGAPGALDTLNELAAAINDDSSYASTVTTALATKLTIANNLSDLANAGTARTNLGLGSLATLSAVGAAQITDNSVGAAELNVTGNGTTAQFLRSDGDGSFTWAAPSVSNITTSDIAAATLVVAAEGIGSNDNDTTLPTSAAVKAYVDSVALSGAGIASVVEDTTPQLGGDLDTNGNDISYSTSLEFVNASNTSLSLSPTAVSINAAGANVDFQVKGDTDLYLLYTDASTDRVGIGTNTPSYLLDVDGTANATTLSIGGTAITATAAELNYVDGVTSNIQTQLNAKAATSSLGALATLSSVNAATITDNSVGAAELNVTGNGTTSQYLRSDGDGTFTWATPPDNNTTYSAGGGLSLSSTTFSHADTSSAANLTASSRTYVTALTFDGYGHVTGYSTGTETVTDTNTTYTAGTGLALSSTTFNINLASATTQTVAPNAVSATASRTYAVQTNSSDQLVVNVPWVDTNTNTTYSAGGGLTLSGTTFSHTDTSSAANLTASSRTYVTALTFDTYGHVTGYSTGTETVTDTNTTYSAGTSLTLSGTTFSVTSNGIGATQLNVTGDGTTAQYLRSDGDGSFTWATPPDTNTTYSAGGGLSLSSTTFSHADTSTATNLTASSRTYVTALTFDTYGHVTGYSTGTETVTDTNTTYSAGTSLTLSGTTFSVTSNGIGATQLNVTGNGTTAQYLRSDGDGSFTWATPPDTNTQLSEEQVEDYVGGMVTGNTETLITVTYQDADGTLDFAVDSDLNNYSNTNSKFVNSNTTGGADLVSAVVVVTQAEYDALTPNSSTLYFIK